MTASRDRRSFLARLATLGAALGVTPRDAAALPGAAVPDDSWIARLGGAHRVVFHSHLPTEGLALRWAQTYLDTQSSRYGLTDRDCSVVVGLNGRSIGWFFSNQLWAAHPTVGEVMGSVGAVNPQAALVTALQRRGVILLACGNSIRAAGQRFLPTGPREDPVARTAFAKAVESGLLPGVEIVPSMVVTLQQAQDRGCRYIYAGS